MHSLERLNPPSVIQYNYLYTSWAYCVLIGQSEINKGQIYICTFMNLKFSLIAGSLHIIFTKDKPQLFLALFKPKITGEVLNYLSVFVCHFVCLIQNCLLQDFTCLLASRFKAVNFFVDRFLSMNFLLVVCVPYRIRETEKMGGLSCGMTCMKYLLLAFNLVFWVSLIRFSRTAIRDCCANIVYISLVRNTRCAELSSGKYILPAQSLNLSVNKTGFLSLRQPKF